MPPSSREALRDVPGLVDVVARTTWPYLWDNYEDDRDDLRGDAKMVLDAIDAHLFGTPTSGDTPDAPPDAKEPVR